MKLTFYMFKWVTSAKIMHNIQQQSPQWNFSSHLHVHHSFILCTGLESSLKQSHLSVLKRLMTKTLYKLSLIFWSMKHSVTINKDILQWFITIRRPIKFRFSCQNTVQLSVAWQPHFLTSNPINLVIYFHFLSTYLQQHGINC